MSNIIQYEEEDILSTAAIASIYANRWNEFNICNEKYRIERGSNASFDGHQIQIKIFGRRGRIDLGARRVKNIFNVIDVKIFQICADQQKWHTNTHTRTAINIRIHMKICKICECN